MSSINMVALSGRLGRDFERHETADGKVWARSAMAVDVRKDAPPQWFNLKAWGKVAESCLTHGHKGRRILVRGRLESRTFEGDDKKKVTIVSVVLDDFPEYASPPRRGNEVVDSANDEWPTGDPPTSEPEDIPF